MVGCETVSNWEVGSSLLWKGSYEGKQVLFVKGHIKGFNINKRLEYTVFDSNCA